MKFTTKGIIKSISVVAGVIVGAFLLIVISAGFGYISGLVLKLIFGQIVCEGLNLLFNTNRFEPQYLPVLCSALTVISVFLSGNTSRSSKKE